MNFARWSRITLAIAAVAAVLLAYWVYTTIAIAVFDFKVFQQNISESFFLSIFGLLALVLGSLAINVMLNLTRLADQRDGSPNTAASPKAMAAPILCVLLFPLIFAGLYWGDKATSAKQETRLVEAANQLINENGDEIASLANYQFTDTYRQQAAAILRRIGSIDENFPSVSVIVQDAVAGKPVFIQITSQPRMYDNRPADRTDFIFSASKQERDYLAAAFANQQQRYRFSANDGNYELYKPVKTERGTIVIYFSDQARYGKFGS